MAELDEETLERVARWCAEAGRQAGHDEIRAALGSLSWDQLLAVRALLADPPPARPLGPLALADLARGAPADVAAERERGGQYRFERTRAGASATAPAGGGAREASGTPRPRGATARARRGRAKSVVVVRRAADRAPPAPVAPPALPHLADLFRPEGRNTLERLVRRLGARRAALLADLTASHRAPDGVADRELDALLEHHGLARAFAHRERDELLHAVRASGGSLGVAARRVGLESAALAAALERLGATAEAERIREERRAELRRRSTLTERAGVLFEEAARVTDLGIEAELLDDLRTRLPEHLRALGASGEAGLDALARSLELGPDQARALLLRLGIALDGLGSASAAGRPPADDRRGRRDLRGPRAGGASRGGTGRADRPPGRRPEARPGARPGGRPGGRTTGPGSRPAGRGPGRKPADARSVGPGRRPASGPGRRTGPPAGKPGVRTGGRPGGRSGASHPRGGPRGDRRRR